MTAAMEAPVAQFPACLDFLFEPHRYKVAYGGRGGAKSWGFARALLLLGAQSKLRILCLRETQKSIADSSHAILSDQIQLLGLEEFYQVQTTGIYGLNGTEFLFHGMRQMTVANLKSIEGCDIAWFDEAQSGSKHSWEVLIPTIRKNNSEIWISMNPQLESDASYMKFVVNPPPNAVVRKVGWRDNPWFPEVLRIEKDHLERTDPAAYLHVYEGEPRGTVEGAIFAEEMQKADSEGRICLVPYDRTRPVDTYWDLGFGDAMAIWFVQPVGGWYNLIDCLTNHGKPINWYQIQLQQRGYVYGTHYLPHDAVNTIIHQKLANHDKSRSIEMLLREAGLTVRITPMLYVADQINAARTILPQCRFDKNNCDEGLKALRNYQWGPPTKQGVSRREPLHDWSSHFSSALMNMAVTAKQPKRADEPEPRDARPPRLSGPYTPFA